MVPNTDWRMPPVATGVVVGAGLLFTALVIALRRFVTDDAYISLRYARNFAQGHGPVWNPGGEVVEGFSNPLLVLAEALAFRIGIDGVLVARGLGVLAGFALVVACYCLGREVIGRHAAAAAAVIVAATPGLAYWAVGGLETLPMALVLTSPPYSWRALTADRPRALDFCSRCCPGSARRGWHWPRRWCSFPRSAVRSTPRGGGPRSCDWPGWRACPCCRR